jgi:MarR family transcriptional regulator, organic hydroperoxide resistance regulator
MSSASTGRSKARPRAEVIPALIVEIRRLIANSALRNTQIAEKLGFNLTDSQVLNLLDLHHQATPGELAKLTGLTTGGVTVALDRLEKAGYVRRERNPDDRRSLIVRPVAAKLEQTEVHYKEINRAMDLLFARFTDEELRLVLRFLVTMNSHRIENSSK